MQKLGDAVIHTPPSIRSDIDVLLGDLESVEDAPVSVFDLLRVDFLAELSRELVASGVARAFPDIASFAFWCRRGNLERVAKMQDDGKIRVGLGLVFHICPANVPVNFAYSFAFAFLSGNSSVVRLPSMEFPQVAIIVDSLSKVLQDQRFSILKPTINLVRYPRADHVTEFWLQHALGKIVWGGDATVRHIRSMASRPRSREVAFVDRYSLAAINSKVLLDGDESVVAGLCASLYNDIYQMDQRACSSPQLVVWIGDARDTEVAKAMFWPRFLSYVRKKYKLEAIQSIDKFVSNCDDAINHGNISKIWSDPPFLTRIEISGYLSAQWEQRGFFGTVHESSVPALAEIAEIVRPNFQTLTYFGFSPDELKDFVLENRLQGIDRLVPIGRALDMDMDFLWDGYDLISSLSRVVDIQ